MMTDESSNSVRSRPLRSVSADELAAYFKNCQAQLEPVFVEFFGRDCTGEMAGCFVSAIKDFKHSRLVQDWLEGPTGSGDAVTTDSFLGGVTFRQKPRSQRTMFHLLTLIGLFDDWQRAGESSSNTTADSTADESDHDRRPQKKKRKSTPQPSRFMGGWNMSMFAVFMQWWNTTSPKLGKSETVRKFLQEECAKLVGISVLNQTEDSSEELKKGLTKIDTHLKNWARLFQDCDLPNNLTEWTDELKVAYVHSPQNTHLATESTSAHHLSSLVAIVTADYRKASKAADTATHWMPESSEATSARIAAVQAMRSHEGGSSSSQGQSQ